MKLRGAKLKRSLMLLVILTCGCAGLRTEFYRGETRYIYNRGCQSYKQGDFGEARESFEKVLALDPNYGPAHGALGNLDLVKGDPETAIGHYQNAVRVDPGLETVMRPFIVAATAQAARVPIIKAGVDLRSAYKLVMANKQAELEALLTKDVPLDLLAKDTLSIAPSELGELAKKVAVSADAEKGSVRYRLFSAYLLFFTRKEPALAVALIEKTVADAEIEDRKKAYVILGQIRERSGDFNLAVDAYLMAVNAGLPISDAAYHLSRIYGLDV
ncbi:MAG: tetratricopeptide repeat protein, partial [Desulfobacterales bacterium]|nr:tetratricopeptide repeat protein [Desulfobacterales bacterium]